MKNEKSQTGTWDKYGASYRHVISFTNGKEIVGYSKKNGFQETPDHVKLLTNLILRLLLRGYLDERNTSITPIKQIAFYGNSVSKDERSIVPLMILYYRFAEYIAIVERTELNGLIHNLDRMYELIGFNISTSEIYSRLYMGKSTYKLERDPMDTSTKRFNSVHALNNYAVHLLTQSYTQDQVVNFCREYSKVHWGKPVTINFRSAD